MKVRPNIERLAVNFLIMTALLLAFFASNGTILATSTVSPEVGRYTLPPAQLITKDASELVLTIADFEPGWVQQSTEPSTKEGAQSAYHVYFLDSSLLPLSPPVIQNTTAVYPSIELAQQVYLDAVPKNVSVENPQIGDECFLDISISVQKRLVFRKINVVVWLWLQQDMFGDVKPYARILEKRISHELQPEAEAPAPPAPSSEAMPPETGGWIVGLILGTVGLAFYLLPTIIAWRRNKRNTLAIAMLNLFGGWTIIGWFVAFIWSMTRD